MSPDAAAGSPTPRKARRGGNVILWVALVLAFVAGGANFQYARSLEGSRVTMLKAKAAIPIGTKVTSAMFDTIAVSGELEDMRGLFVDDRSLLLFQQLPLARSLKRGQPLMQSDFEPGATQSRCQDTMAADQRAIPLPADTVSTHTFSIQVNDVIDVWVTPGGRILEGALVCALDGQTSVSPGARYSTLSVLVQEAEIDGVLSAIGGNGKRLTFVPKKP